MKTNFQHMGRWPVEGPKARIEKRLIPIPGKDFLHFIHGEKNPAKVSLFVSNDYLNVGIMSIPEGRQSDPEEHKGDEALYVLQGTLGVKIFSRELGKKSVSHEGHRVRKDEEFLVPGNRPHQYFNFGTGVVKVIFGISVQ